MIALFDRVMAALIVSVVLFSVYKGGVLVTQADAELAASELEAKQRVQALKDEIDRVKKQARVDMEKCERYAKAGWDSYHSQAARFDEMFRRGSSPAGTSR